MTVVRPRATCRGYTVSILACGCCAPCPRTETMDRRETATPPIAHTQQRCMSALPVGSRNEAYYLHTGFRVPCESTPNPPLYYRVRSAIPWPTRERPVRRHRHSSSYIGRTSAAPVNVRIWLRRCHIRGL